MDNKFRAPRNRTLTLTDDERATFASRLLRVARPVSAQELLGRTVCQDLLEVLPYLPPGFVDLAIIDPPYNLDKSFNGNSFKSQSAEDYAEWFSSWLVPLRRVLKPTASLYVCCDWRCSAVVERVARHYFLAQNRITWEREKGRGAFRNWKNCSEDIWFFTVSSEYTFNVDAVKLKRRVIAPYTDADGQPKDWTKTENGGFRLTHPSNLWTDISVPFWSMPENTDHPTQKPEKLIAKLVLGSSNPGDVVFDPFLGSGTTSVVSKKLGRMFAGIEIDELYCCLAEKRLAMADEDGSIQGYHGGVFWERNSLADQKEGSSKKKSAGARQKQLSF
jgi:site-specific DNA-methyltransferase (adenine-specific)